MYIFCDCIAVLYLLANGVYALLAPAKWSKAKWTTKRGLTDDVSDGVARSVGVLSLLVAAMFLFAAIRESAVTLGSATSRLDEAAWRVLHFLIPALWSSGALALVISGVWAIARPYSWRRLYRERGIRYIPEDLRALRALGAGMMALGAALLTLGLRRGFR